MSQVHIDRLLDTVIKQKASDLHIVVGRPPTLRMRGRLVPLKTKILDPGDTIALMKSIAPERSQTELQEEGGSDFGFASATPSHRAPTATFPTPSTQAARSPRCTAKASEGSRLTRSTP